jgi:hypothetical protein
MQIFIPYMCSAFHVVALSEEALSAEEEAEGGRAKTGDFGI